MTYETREIRKNKNWFKDLIAACWGVLNFTRKAFINLFFVFSLIVLIAVIGQSQEEPFQTSPNSILKLKLVGSLVDELTYVDPYDELLGEALGGGDDKQEILLVDLLDVLDVAETDSDIEAIWLDLQQLKGSGLSKLQELGLALKRFKENSGKPIFVYGDYFSQGQYYIAAQADKIFLHPMGAVGIEGFGRYQTYLKSALEKLKIHSHIFRVGTYKSAVEPYLRDDMSNAAKEANQQWLTELWEIYKQDIANARGMETNNFDEELGRFITKFKQADGSFAQFALNNSWVDELKTHQEFHKYMDNNYKDANVVSYTNYLSTLVEEDSANKIGVIVARGAIYNGKRKAGETGGHSTAELLRQARKDKSIKAVVLRVDSPGGSAFASEIIRNEVEALKRAGKPVVVSMSSLAASGGYWISASADEIWAAPTTITGSIGIFGMFMTFEESFKELGIYTDGVATTEMAGLSPMRELTPEMSDIIQLSIEQGYRKFIGLVASERNMDYADVDKVAQGRVWSGKTAKELGLVDNLGFFYDAVDSAASLANLEEYGVEYVTKPLEPMEQLLKELMGAYVVNSEDTFQPPSNPIMSVLYKLATGVNEMMLLNDPQGMYLYCIECDSF